jgi:hypothetical protein
LLSGGSGAGSARLLARTPAPPRGGARSTALHGPPLRDPCAP